MRTSSLDEASLDVTAVCAARGMTGWQVAQEIRDRMKRETGLTCSGA
jgi:nucleotidyltransferase/DNA polymerase involved in DNA repair